MNGAELLDYTRTVVLRDTAVPYLWSDATIYSRLNKAQEIHARKTYSIVDDTQSITTDTDTPTYALPTGTVHVMSARVSTNARDMRDFTRKALPSHLTTGSGEPSIYTLDEATGLIRFYVVPDASYEVLLRVARTPSVVISTNTTPEIPERYHTDLASYAAWQCLQDNDADGDNTGASDRHMKDWFGYLAEAKREFYRLQLGANPNAVSSWTGKRG